MEDACQPSFFDGVVVCMTPERFRVSFVADVEPECMYIRIYSTY